MKPLALLLLLASCTPTEQRTETLELPEPRPALYELTPAEVYVSACTRQLDAMGMRENFKKCIYYAKFIK